jgi:hypothetical protein
MDNQEEVDISLGHVEKALAEITVARDQGHEYVSKLPLLFAEVEQLRAEYRLDLNRKDVGDESSSKENPV